MSVDSASDVSGPVATISGYMALAASGMPVTSSRTIVIAGWPPTAEVMALANASRSTANAAPAGTRVASAQRMTMEPSRRISSLRTPTALSNLSPRKELLQTSSARRSAAMHGGRTDRPHLVQRDAHAA